MFFHSFLNLICFIVSFFFASSIGINNTITKLRQRITAMDKFVTGGQNKCLCTSDVLTRSPRKKVKLENDERMKKEEDEEDEEDEYAVLAEFSHPVPWQKIEAEGLDLDYALLFSKEEADQLFKQLEEEVVYSTGITLTIFLYNHHCTLQFG